MNAILLLALLPCTAAVQEPSVKDLLDGQLGALRAAQAPDGSYGTVRTTAEVLTAMALGPRAYREEDGPFIRGGVQALLRAVPAELTPASAAAAAFALHSLDAQRYAARIGQLVERSGMPPEALGQLAGQGRLLLHLLGSEPWLEGLPFDRQRRPAVAILLAVPDRERLPGRARAAALAVVSWRREQAEAAAAAPLDPETAFRKGAGFLLEARGSNGLWEVMGRPEPGISALAAGALLGSPDPAHRSAAATVLDWLRTVQDPDGSVGSHLKVYVTSVAVGAWARGARAEDQESMRRGAAYLRAAQADEGEGYSEADKFYGGIGYGNDLRPDLSNLQYALQALHEAGTAPDDEAYQRALVFLQRSQNRSESNPGTFRDQGDPRPVRAGNDGGAVYYPGNSPAGMTEMPDGTLVARSYGSMSYALLKCYFYAGLDAADPRVKSLVQWIERHWTLEVNPGFDTLRDPDAGFQGLYYYYLTLAEALQAAAIDEIVSPDGVRHDWRRELGSKLLALQRGDGSWINERASRWWEGNPVLCTAYALNTLAAVRR